MATSQIATNFQAVRTHNVFAKNNAGMNAALTRVSTGLKINSAKDGGAQYAISEKMRERINSNEQVSQNVQNDSALARTASSGLDNTLSILKTLKARALDSANDSNDTTDRNRINSEVQALIAQIDSNAETVKYNGKALLSGEFSGDDGVLSNTQAIYFTTEITGGATATLGSLGIIASDTAPAKSGTANLTLSWTKGGVYHEEVVSSTFKSETTLANVLKAVTDKITGVTTSANTASTALGSLTDSNGDPVYPGVAGLAIYADSSGKANAFSDLKFTISPNNSAYGQSKTYTFEELQKGLDASSSETQSLKFQIGEESGMSVSLNIAKMDATGLSLSGLAVDTQAKAESALSVIDGAISKVLQQQTDIGAMEQRLGYVADNLDTINENLQAADSAVRDADMSKEISNFMKYSVLSQSAQYMLAQSHQNAFQVLNLLQ